MKTKLTVVIVFLVAVFTVNAFDVSTQTQETKTIKMEGIFEGYDADDGYAFLIKSDNEEGEQSLYIQSISDAALKMVKLQSKEMEGKRFEMTCEVTEYKEKDENGK
jgi:hypothetical protein